MHAIFKGLTIGPDPATLMDDPSRFVLTVRMMVGPSDSLGEESFDLTVCTPEWLAEQCRAQGGMVNARHHVVVNYASFDERALRAWLTSMVERTSGASWAEVAEKVGRLGYWEFEDYRS